MVGGLITSIVLLAGSADTRGPYVDGSADVLPVAVTNGRTMDAALVDLDNDADLDLVGASEFGQNFVCIWDGGRFELARDALPQNVRRDSEDIAAADFDGDGFVDMFFVSEDDELNDLYINEGFVGSTVFRDESRLLPPAGARGVSNAVAAGDVDGDGDIDLLIGNAGSPSKPAAPGLTGGQNVLLINNGDGTFEHAKDALPKIRDRTQDVEFGDIDGDGDPDAIIANEDANRLLVNDGSGTFTDATEALLGYKDDEETREADFGDVDGDGDLDLYFANVAWSGAAPFDRLLLNDGKGAFTDASDRLPRLNIFSLDADLVDLDADGDLDVVIASIIPGPPNAGRPVTILDNQGGRFVDRSDWIPASIKGNGIDVEAADIDGDGTIDIYVANHTSGDWVLLG